MPDLERQLLAGAGFEIIPLKSSLEKADLLPPGSTVTVTASPSKGMEPTVDLALELCRRGYQAVPHLAARSVRDRAQLSDLCERLAGGGVEEVLVIGGDGEDPGDYDDALTLIREMVEIGHRFRRLGIAGYPEGHPLIEDDKLTKALIDKQPFATYIVTQMCFDPRTIALWVSRIRTEGIELPVQVGIPGVIDPTKLLTIAARIGVGASARFLAKNRRAMLRLLTPGAFRPDRLLRGLVRYGEGLGLTGLHIFTFNQVAPTLEWYRRAQART
jgi:methylenetetrahydrofolate reductase (NADPH)